MKIPCLLALSVVAGSSTGVTHAASTEPLALTNANVVDVRAGQVRAGVTIVLHDGKITSVGTAPPPAGVRTLDVRGRYLVPGLVDAHTHIRASPPRARRSSRA